MDELVAKQKANRRRNMSAEQLANLQRLELFVARYQENNSRMARGLTIGFRRLEQTEGMRARFSVLDDRGNQ